VQAIRIRLGGALVPVSVVLLLGLGIPRQAEATLAGDVVSVLTNQARLGASRTEQKLATGTRHDLYLPSGTIVHEYVSLAGAVYAIDWRGPRMPNLRELLGSYFASLDEPGSIQELHRRNVSGDDFELRSFAHRGFFAGRAWVPSKVPAGVRPDEIFQQGGQE
jgi:hypothetical protein